MKKTISINLGGRLFNIEEDAYEKLNNYLKSIKNHYQDSGGEEIIADIEISIADKFAGKKKGGSESISIAEIEEVIKIMGTIEEFDSEEDDRKKEPEADKQPEMESLGAPKKLYRDSDDVIIAGVCSGIAAFFGIEAIYIRLIFILSIFLNGLGIFAYIILWIVMPQAKTNSQKLEMQGKPVNLKKLEETIKEKSAGLRESLKKDGGRKFNKILSFPVEVIRQVAGFFKKIAKAIIPFISVIAGLGITIVALAAISGLALAAGVAIFNINSPYVISDIPLKELSANFSYYPAIGAWFAAAFIPLVFLLTIGLSLIGRRNMFNMIFSLALIALWIASFVVAGLATIDLVPRINEMQAQRVENAENNVREFQYDGIDSLKVGTRGPVSVHRGEEFKIEARGGEAVLENLVFEENGGELTIYQKNRRKGICIFCSKESVSLDITLPELRSFFAYNQTEAEIIGFEEGRDLTVNAGERARVKLQADGGNLKSNIDGSGLLEIAGSPDSFEAVLEGMGRLKALDLAASSTALKQYHSSSASLGGEAKMLSIELSDSASLEAFNLEASEIEAELSDRASAEVFPIEHLAARVSDSSNILYLNEPKEIERLIFDDGKIRKAAEWERRLGN